MKKAISNLTEITGTLIYRTMEIFDGERVKWFHPIHYPVAQRIKIWMLNHLIEA